MDRRVFLILTLAGAADPAPSNSPDSIGALLIPPAPAPVDTGSEQFDAWAKDFIERAIRVGLPADILNREFQGLTPDPQLEALDSRQPEFSKPVGDYVRGVVTEARVAQGRAKRAAITALPAIETRYGVPDEILVSIWAVETAYGTQMGDFDVLRSLATLAAAGRRRDWAEDQLKALIRIIASGEASRAQLRGSWAGAMGQTQFEPTAFLDDAVDADGDGRRDIWGSSTDALASAANLLAKAGWRRGEPWQREVRLASGFDYGLAEGTARSQAAWAAIGARPADAGGWPGADSDAPAQLLLPAGATGPALLAFPNHFIIRKYNNAMSYALAVGLLADRIAGRPALVAAWPAETPLSLADRMAAQQALTALNYNPGAIDGVIGANTRTALRAWQKAEGLPADGYLSEAMVLRLQTAAGSSAVPHTGN